MKTSNNLGCNCSCGCGAVGTIFGIILGVIVAVLFSLGLTPLILSGIWVAFSVGVASLAFVLILAAFTGCSTSCCNVEKCLIKKLKCLLIGILGTILTTLALVSISLEISSIVVTIIVALATFFLIFLISSIVSFLKCLVYRQ